MKGLANREDVHRAAKAALAYYEKAFEERKEEWISDTAQLTYRKWFKTYTVGREEAEKLFDGGIFEEFYDIRAAYGGRYWIESLRIETLTNLVWATEADKPEQIILEQKELAGLYGFWQ